MPPFRAQVGQLSPIGILPRFRGVAEWGRIVEGRYFTDPTGRRAAKAVVDWACGALSVVVAIALSEGMAWFGVSATIYLALAVGCFVVVAEALVGSYRSMWRYMSFHEAAALTTCSVLLLATLLTARWVWQVPLALSTVLLMVLLTLFSCIGVRALRRWQVGEVKRRASRRQTLHPTAAARWVAHSTHRILIAGAGEHGLSISRDLAQSGARGVELVGFVDDDPAKVGAFLNALPVLGRLSDVLAVAERHRVTEVVVAMPFSDPAVVRSLVRRVEDSGIRARAVRGVDRFVMGQDPNRPGAATLHELLDSAGLKGTYPQDDHGTRRVLITGGAGYVGAHLTRMLLDRGYHVRILDRFDYGRAGIAGLHHPRLEIVRGDICNSRDLGQAVRGVEAVAALAAIVGDPACNLDPEETINLNYTATKILVDACNLYGVRRLVFASSCSVYGAGGQALLTERSRLNPVSLYARTRVLSENIMFDRRGEVEPVALRLATVFGLSPRMRFDLVVNTLTAHAVVDGRIAIFGGNQWRPNVHCRDAARAFAIALQAPAAAVAGEIFNVGGDRLNHRIQDLGTMVAQIVGDVAVDASADVADPRDYRVSFQKIRRLLGFEPEFSVADGIREVAEAVRSDSALRRYRDAGYHNVQALRQHRDLRSHAPALSAAMP